VSFVWPLFLLTLLAVPAGLAGYLLLQRRRARYAVRFTNLEVLAAVVPEARPWRRYVPVALFLLSLSLALAALARPELTVSAPRENASVVLAIDSSGSMYSEDVPPTRLGAAQEAVRRFLKKLPARYRVGLVTFSSEAQVVASLTTDRQLVLKGLGYLFPGSGTAIGDGIARSVELARTDAELGGADVPPGGTGRPTNSPVAIVLLSDGAQTRGILTPLQGAARAKAAGIPIYTVALGTLNGIVTFTQGPYSRTFPVPPDRETLRQVAMATGGQFYAAASASGLDAVYDKLGSSIGRVPQKREETYAALGLAALLLAAAWAFSTRWGQRLP
jgi:Ca-activated chloride channel family protein